MEIILIIIGGAFLWGLMRIASTRKASINLQDIIQYGINEPRSFFNNLSVSNFEELKYLDVNKLKGIILGRMIEIAITNGVSMSAINNALRDNVLRRICEYGAEEIAQSIYRY